MDARDVTTPGQAAARATWDTDDGRLARRGVELVAISNERWELRLPRPRAMGPGQPLRSRSTTGLPPVDFAEIVWPLTHGRSLHEVDRQPDGGPVEGTTLDAPRRHDQVLRTCASNVTQALPWARVDEAAPANIRSLRTAVRRLRTHLRSLRPLHRTPPDCWEGLGRLNDHVRAVRDLDLVFETLPKVHRFAQDRGEAAGATDMARLLELVAEDRRRTRNELWAELAHRRTGLLVEQLDHHPLVELDERSSPDDAELAREVLRRQVHATRSRAAAAEGLETDALLALRTSARRTRVLAISAAEVLGDDALRLGRRALEVQDALGAVAEMHKALGWLEALPSEGGGSMSERLTSSARAQLDAHRDAWRAPWDRLDRRRVSRWL